MENEAVRILLVEDQEIVRLGLRKMLEQIPGLLVVAEAADGYEAVTLCARHLPDLVMMDIGLPRLDGIEATKRIKATCSSKVLMITSHESDNDVLAALSSGADGYCLKGVSTKQLGAAIAAIVEDTVWLDPGIARTVIGAATSKGPLRASQRNPNDDFKLSERELQVLTLLVEGLSNLQMAERLYLSPETVKSHLRHVMNKLSVSDRTQAAVKAIKEGLVSSVT